MTTYDVAIVGAGVIGLSIAWELTEHGQRVLVLDGSPGRNSASWAAAGMLPPMNAEAAADPLDQLHGCSHAMYPEWVARLQQASGIDVEFWPCGSLHVATAAGESAALIASVAHWQEDGVRFESWDASQLSAREPTLNEAVKAGFIRVAYFLPDERQIQPRLVLIALRRALERRGIAIATVPPNGPFQIEERTGWRILSGSDQFAARHVCLAAGAYTRNLFRQWEITIDLEPRRGQMIQLEPGPWCPSTIIDQGPRYLVPRRDGRLLVGSTVEDVGFDDGTRPDDLRTLHEFAAGLIPILRDVAIESAWAGLRPRMGKGYPVLGSLPARPTLWLATGHFRNGIQLAPATAALMRQLILQQEPLVDPLAFRL